VKLTYNSTRERYEWEGGYKSRWQPKSSGFRWDSTEKRWWTEHRERAFLLRRFADSTAKAELGDFTQEAIPTYRRDAVLLGIQMLSASCDGARTLDGEGFSKADVHIGKGLARHDTLTSEQAELGLKLLREHQHQLPRDLLVLAGAVRRVKVMSNA